MTWVGADLDALLAAGLPARRVREVSYAYDGLAAYLASDPAELDGRIPEHRELPDGVVAVGWQEGSYPRALAAISAPPPVLYVRGVLQGPGVAVVGTRSMTQFGKRAVRAAVAGAASVGAPVIGGLALGCDAAGHRATLAAGLPTVAVVATHPDAPTPRSNVSLASEIVAAGGAVVSEQPPGVVVPRPRALMARNRVIVGLSSVVVPAEAGCASGTMGAVRCALAEDRALVVPCPRDPGRGRDGLTELCSVAPDLDALGIKGSLASAMAGRAPLASAVARDPRELSAMVAAAFGSSRWTGPHE